MQLARDVAGQLLHTLQDFYSHTNWIEMGRRTANAALGVPGKEGSIGNVAGPDEPTCYNCKTER